MAGDRRYAVFDRRSTGALLALALLVNVVAAAVAGEPPPPVAGNEAATPLTFEDEISVELIGLAVRVVDSRGEPLRGLGPEDFRVWSRGEELPVVAVDWVSPRDGAESEGAGEPADVAAREVEAGEGERAREAPSVAPTPVAPTPVAPIPVAPIPGNRVVFFVQADHNAVRVRGHLRMLHYAGELLDTFHPSDQAAVVSFDSHLKLWQDFTGDLDAVREALEGAVRFGGRPPRIEGGELGLDVEAARDAAIPEAALRVTAEALQAIPGAKSLVYLGWGLGRYGFFGISLGADYRRAVDALHAAGTSVFVLDVTDADLHTLEVGLRSVASATGGTYAKTNLFAAQAVMRLSRILSGYYLLSVRPGGTVATGAFHVELRERSATVLLLPPAAG
jgi:VWFA-related protein